MSRAIDFLARRLAAFAIAFALCAGFAHATITLTTVPESPIPNGKTAAVAARVESAKTVARVYLQYRFRDAKALAADPDAPWSAWHDQEMVAGEGNEWAGFLPILPAGQINWCVCAEYTDGSSEGKAETVDAQSYDYVHDMRADAALAASCQTPTNGEDVVVANWGWRQDTSAVGGTNFFANAPGGGQWRASGVGWAVSQNRKFRVPALGGTFLYVGSGLSYPVLFLFNLNPELKPHIRAPKLESGLGSISFSVYNVAGTTSKLMVQKAYTDGEPGEADWQDVEEYPLPMASTNYSFTNVVNDAAVTYVRILRTHNNESSASPYTGAIGIDDICVMPPEPTTQTTEIAGRLDYGRLHDMKGITNLVATSGDYYVEEYGWRQDTNVGGKITSGTYRNTSTSTNFYAVAPNGSRWEASGVGWAANNGIASRLPHLGLSGLRCGDGLTYPVLFFFNLDPDLKPYIRTPRLDGGLGTFSFEARNTWGTTSRLMVQVAYTDGTPDEGDWFEVEEYELPNEESSYGFTNVVNDISVTYVRVLRTERYTGSSADTTGVIGIDNICATPPTPDVVLFDGKRDPWNMNAGDPTTVRCLVSNIYERTPAVNQSVTVHYALTTGRGVSVDPGNFIFVAMAYVCETNGCSLFEGTIPAQGVVGWLHYYFRCDFEGYYYVSPEANGMATPKYLCGGECTATAPASAVSAFEVKERKWRHSDMAILVCDFYGESVRHPMTHIGDNLWAASFPMGAGEVAEVCFVGSGCYDEATGGILNGPVYYSREASCDCSLESLDADLIGPCAGTNGLPFVTIRSSCDQSVLFIFNESPDGSSPHCTIRRGAFQDFGNWISGTGYYYGTSTYGVNTGFSEVNFDDWARPYGWLPISDMKEDFGRVSPTNGEYRIYGDQVPNDCDFDWGNVRTPEGWYLSGSRLTNARVTHTNTVYTYGGCSNVLAQVMSGGSFFNSDESLSQGVDEVVARMRSSVIDGAKALYVGDDPDNPVVYSHSSSTPLRISTSFSIPSTDRADTHYYTSLVFDYRDDLNFHELRFTRGDATGGSSTDRRLKLELVEVRNGVERKSVHSLAYVADTVNNGATHKFTAAISMSGSTLTVSLSGLANLSGNWTGISLNNCDPAATFGQVGFGAYECAPKIDYIVVSGGTGGMPYSAGSDKAYPSTASSRFAAGRWKWFLGGSDYTASSSGTATKWYFDSGENYVLRRRVPSMNVTLKVGPDPFVLPVSGNMSVSSLQYSEFRQTFHAWKPLYMEFSVEGKDGSNCVVFDSVAVTPWRAATRGPGGNHEEASFGWTSQREQNDWASSSENSRDWLVFEGWAITNPVTRSVAAAFQKSQANPDFAQGLYSPVLWNGIGSVMFDYDVQGELDGKVVYSVECTMAGQFGDFGDGSSHGTCVVWTNSVGDAGSRTCAVNVNHLRDADGCWIPARLRIRVIPDGTSPDAALLIDNVRVGDFPEESDDSWKFYNGVTIGAGEYPRDVFGGNGRALALNDSTDGGILPRQTPFTDSAPYLQTPCMANGMDGLSFSCRAMSEPMWDVAPPVIGIAACDDAWKPFDEWTVVTNLTVSGTAYADFSISGEELGGRRFARVFAETNGCGRVLVDNVAVYENYPQEGGQGDVAQTEDGFWKFSVSNGGATVVSCDPGLALGDVCLPDVLCGHPVTAIGDYAFRNCGGIASISMPAGVRSIGRGAFAGCRGLERVVIPRGVVRIGPDAFRNCVKLVSVSIPGSVVEIGVGAFAGCGRLAAIDVDEGNPAFMSVDGMLLSKNGRTLLAGINGDVVIPQGVAHIADMAFCGYYGLNSVAIPLSVTTIDANAFAGCRNIAYVEIPGGWRVPEVFPDSYEAIVGAVVQDGSEYIAERAFEGCGGLAAVTIPKDVEKFGERAFAGCAAIVEVIGAGWYGMPEVFPDSYATVTNAVIWPGVKEIVSNAFLGCGIVAITIPGGVASIGSDAFRECRSLTSLVIPDGVTSIGKYAFYGCTGLTSITIPDGVTSIGEYAFYDCISLTSVHISDLVAWCRISFGDYRANPCRYAHRLLLNGEEITNLVIPAIVTSIGSSAFNGCSGLTSVTIPNGVTNIEWAAFSNCSGLTSVTIPDSVTSIGEGAFSGCSGLASVAIPNSVKYIGSYAFYGCNSVTFVAAAPEWENRFSGYTNCAWTIPDGVTSIGKYAFYDCSGLTSVTIPNSVKYIGSYAFNGCSGLTSVTIGKGVTSIGSYAFCYCTGLTSITIPDGVTSIGEYAFYACDGLTSVHISDLAAWCQISFGDYRANPCCYAHRLLLNGEEITNLVIPAIVTSIGSAAFNGCSGLTSVTIPNGVTSIGEDAFNGCSGLASVTIPNGVTSIGSAAFNGCSGLTSVTIGKGVTSIGSSVFNRCSGLASVTIPNGVTSIGDYAFSGCSGLTSLQLPLRFKGKTSSLSIPWGCSIVFHGFCELAISSDYGTPSPGVGTNVIEVFTPTTVTCGVNEIQPSEINGVRHVCTGWTGTGSIPASGTGTNCTFEIEDDSSIAWNWKTQNLISVTATGAGSCGFGSQWVDDGETATAALLIPDTAMRHPIILSGDTDGVAIDGATLSIPSDGPRSVNAMVPASDVVEDGGAPFSWTVGESGVGWSIVADADATDGFVLRSDDIGAGEAATIEAIVDGPGRLAFDWRISANRGDYARIYVDGVQAAQITRDTAWAPASVVVDGDGAHTVRWAYEHRASAAANANAAFLDNVSWHPMTLTLAEALDGEGLAWTTDTGAEWRAQLTETTDGEDAAVSGPVDENGVSGLETTVTGPGTLAWSWRLVAEDVAGLDVIVDGDFANPARAYEDSGDWAEDSLAFDDGGHHTVRFEFWNLGSSPSDCAYLDCVSWTPAAPESIVVDGVEVPVSWLDEYPALLSDNGGDYEAAANATAANGVNKVWECYVAGLCPTNATEMFRTIISWKDGAPEIGWEPDLNENGTKQERVYAVEGRESLSHGSWGPTNANSRFFRVKVEMK